MTQSIVRAGVGLLILAMVSGSLAGEAAAQTAQKMYWTDLNTGKIQRANLDGSAIQDLVTGLSGPHGIALDLAVGGVAHGFQPTKVVCTNVTTGKTKKITLAPGALFWDCGAAGLVVRPGDSLKMKLNGSE